MEIAFVSSLTPEDEARFASTFMAAIAGILDVLPIAYSIHIKTSAGTEIDRTHMPSEDNEPRETVAVEQIRAGATSDS